MVESIVFRGSGETDKVGSGKTFASDSAMKLGADTVVPTVERGRTQIRLCGDMLRWWVVFACFCIVGGGLLRAVMSFVVIAASQLFLRCLLPSTVDASTGNAVSVGGFGN